jgi:hypothetical protein
MHFVSLLLKHQTLSLYHGNQVSANHSVNHHRLWYARVCHCGWSNESVQTHTVI